MRAIASAMSSISVSASRAASLLLVSMLTVSIVATAAASPAMAEPAGAESARAVVKQASEELRLLVEESVDTTKAERVERIASVLAATFDLNRVGANIVGPQNYRNWTPEQRDVYVDSFIRYMVATNDSNIRLFESDRFEIVGTEPGPRDLIIVHTRYNLDAAEPAKIDFVVAERDGAWRIVDVHEDAAISLLAVKRAELNSVLKRKGFDGMITLMDKITKKVTAE